MHALLLTLCRYDTRKFMTWHRDRNLNRLIMHYFDITTSRLLNSDACKCGWQAFDICLPYRCVLIVFGAERMRERVKLVGWLVGIVCLCQCDVSECRLGGKYFNKCRCTIHCNLICVFYHSVNNLLPFTEYTSSRALNYDECLSHCFIITFIFFVCLLFLLTKRKKTSAHDLTF